MLVRAYWPNCDRFREVPGGQVMDGLWVEATKEEAEAEILPRLSPKDQERSHAEAAVDWFAKETGNPPRPYCYLVAKDLSVIIPCNCRYPVHQLWNAYSPFGQFEPFSFNKLEELKDFVVPAKITWMGIHDDVATPNGEPTEPRLCKCCSLEIPAEEDDESGVCGHCRYMLDKDD